MLLGRGLDLRTPQGEPKSREEVAAAGSAQPKIQKKARRTPQDLPRAADGSSDTQSNPPVTSIDLTDESSTTVAPPLTLSQGEGRAAPEEPGKAQDLLPRWGKRPRTPVKARWARPNDWEDLKDPVGSVTRTIEADRAYEEEQAKLRDKTGAKEGEQHPGAPLTNPLRDGRTTPDNWEELLDKPTGEGREGSGAYSNSERGEDTNFDPEF